MAHHRHDEFTLLPMVPDFAYDIDHLLDVAHLLKPGTAADLVDNNARVESFLIRFRTLLEFFFSDGSRSTDVRAWEYLDDADDGDALARWKKACPEAHAVFGIDDGWLKQAVSVRIGQASADRLYRMSWPTELMAVGMARVWATFLDELSPRMRAHFEAATRHVVKILPGGQVALGTK